MNAYDLLPLPDARAADVARLYERMQKADCVFDFTVRHLADSVEVQDAHHRALLTLMFDEIEARGAARRAQFIALHPAYAAQPAWALERDVAHARPTPWSTRGLTQALQRQPGERLTIEQAPAMPPAEWLCQAFDNPPYPAHCPPGLFAEFCEAVGLSSAPDVQVFDWVGDMDGEPERSTWSNYFDDGKEWWGIWCLTVWNPEKRTLAALAASTTD